MNNKQDLQAEAQRTLADPSFDVIEFVKQVNEHFANPKIIQTLSSDPMILMSILDNGSFHYLEANPEYVSPKTFQSYSDQGHETWVRKAINGSKISWWYGVHLSNIDVGLTWKKVYGSSWRPKFSLTISKNPKPKTLRSRWKRYKMSQVGVDPKEVKINPIYMIREKLITKLEHMGYKPRWGRRLKSTDASIRAVDGSYSYPNVGNEVNFYIKAISRKTLEISLPSRSPIIMSELDLKGTDDEGEIKNDQWGNSRYCKKFNMDQPNIVNKILHHLRDKSKKHSHLPLEKHGLLLSGLGV